MISAIIRFWGNETDKDGMPNPWHTYFIVATPAPFLGQCDGGIAEILCYTEGCPFFPQGQLKWITNQGGPSKALSEAVNYLRNIPEHAGLNYQSSLEDPSAREFKEMLEAIKGRYPALSDKECVEQARKALRKEDGSEPEYEAWQRET